jgi:hypothetical protein
VNPGKAETHSLAMVTQGTRHLPDIAIIAYVKKIAASILRYPFPLTKESVLTGAPPQGPFHKLLWKRLDDESEKKTRLDDESEKKTRLDDESEKKKSKQMKLDENAAIKEKERNDERDVEKEAKNDIILANVRTSRSEYDFTE